MIEVFNWESAHCHGDALASQHRLRHRIFVERQGYQVPTYNGLEYDSFDTPAAYYAVRRDDQGVVRAVNRLISCDQPYMLQHLWPGLVEACDLPTTGNIWEGSRIGVDDRLDARTRDRYFAELLCGVLEFGLSRGIDWYIGVMPAAIVQRSMIGAGLDVDLLGTPRIVDESWRVVPVRINVTEASLAEVRRRKGIAGPVLALPEARQVAA